MWKIIYWLNVIIWVENVIVTVRISWRLDLTGTIIWRVPPPIPVGKRWHKFVETIVGRSFFRLVDDGGVEGEGDGDSIGDGVYHQSCLKIGWKLQLSLRCVSSVGSYRHTPTFEAIKCQNWIPMMPRIDELSEPRSVNSYHYFIINLIEIWR